MDRRRARIWCASASEERRAGSDCPASPALACATRSPIPTSSPASACSSWAAAIRRWRRRSTLADVPGARVTLSYRQAAFTRTKALNREHLLAAEDAGAVRIELRSTVKSLEPRSVRLATERGELTLDNDVVFALLGADPPTGFLEQLGCQVSSRARRRWRATPLRGACGRGPSSATAAPTSPTEPACSACPVGGLVELIRPSSSSSRGDAPVRLPGFSELRFCGTESQTRSGTRAAAWPGRWLEQRLLFALLGIGLEAFLRRTLPEWSLMAAYVLRTGQDRTASFGSGRGFGHWLGYIGASLMLLTLLYSLRTRVARFKEYGAQTGWLSAHLWVGFVGATLVTYHSDAASSTAGRASRAS